MQLAYQKINLTKFSDGSFHKLSNIIITHDVAVHCQNLKIEKRFNSSPKVKLKLVIKDGRTAIFVLQYVKS